MPINELSNVDVVAISIVGKGANRKRFFLRKEDAADDLVDLPGGQRIVKADDWSAVYCVVAEPEAEEGAGIHGDQQIPDRWASEEEIRKAAHRFMKNGALVNKMHESLEPYGQLVENAIALADFTVDGETIRKGSWYVAIEPSIEGRAAIDKGEFAGISIEGTGTRTLLEKVDDDALMAELDELLLDGKGRVKVKKLIAMPGLGPDWAEEIAKEVIAKGLMERVPGVQNWVDRVGGLPNLIDRAAAHIHAKGRSVSAAIATAVNWAKKMCATGRSWGGKVKVSAGAQGRACKAVAEWEAKKAAAKVSKAQLAKGEIAWESVESVEELIAKAFDESAHPRGKSGSPEGGRFVPKSKEGKVESGSGTKRTENAEEAAGNILRALGYKGKLGVALRRFQKDEDLEQTGKADPPTMAKLRSRMEARRKKQRRGSSGSLRTVGRVSKLTQLIGKALGIDPDDLAAAAAADAEAEELAKGEPTFGEIMSRRDFDDKMPQAFQAFREAVDRAFFPPAGADNHDPEALISESCDEFKQWALGMLESTGIAKLAEEAEVDLIDLERQIAKRDFTDEERKKLAAKGLALKDGSFPIINAGDLKNALKLLGKASDPDAAKAHIIKRAKALGATDLLPDDWKVSKADGSTKEVPTVGDMASEETKTIDERMSSVEEKLEKLDPDKIAETVAKAVKGDGDGDAPTAESVKKELSELGEQVTKAFGEIGERLEKLGAGGSTQTDVSNGTGGGEKVEKSDKPHAGIL